jgi:hypothetical protein
VKEKLTNPSIGNKQRFVVSLADKSSAISILFICCDVLQESEALNFYKDFHQTLVLPYTENVNI